MKRMLAILVAIAFGFLTNSVQAQDRVTLVAPFPPGGPVDMLAPSETSVTMVEQLAKDAAEILSQTNIKEQLTSQGLSDATQKPSEIALHIKQETQTWARIIKARGISAE